MRPPRLPPPGPAPQRRGKDTVSVSGSRLLWGKRERRSPRARARVPARPAGGERRGPRGLGKRAGARGQGEETAGAHMLLNRKRSSQVKARSVVMLMEIAAMTVRVTVLTLPRKLSRAQGPLSAGKGGRRGPTEPGPALRSRPRAGRASAGQPRDPSQSRRCPERSWAAPPRAHTGCTQHGVTAISETTGGRTKQLRIWEDAAGHRLELPCSAHARLMWKESHTCSQHQNVTDVEQLSPLH